MKVLIYGAGVIGGQLVHVLCVGGHDVTVIARGAWAQTLRESGLRIHYLSYATRYDLRKATRADRKLLLDAVGDAYGLLTRLGVPVRPEGDAESLHGMMPPWEQVRETYGGAK